ncbi:MAG: polysaccharide biosynthesis protein [Gammaproteobacteria bacterium]|nr:polysaccharide biosynthesis protein [Gammaproteobacteria bacterium]MBJ54318.1 polysaccharide biosynthesis protein [Gammaproteobacteria bacterium]
MKEENTEKSHRQILRSSSIIGGASVINILVGILRMKVAAVLLGPAGVGLIGILQNLIATASTISSLGFGNVGTRQIAEANGHGRQDQVDAARRALFWGTLILAILGGGIFWLLREYLATILLNDASLASEVGWLALGVVLTVAAGSQGALLNGMRRIGDIARVRIYSSIVGTFVGVLALYGIGREGLILFVLSAPLSSFLFSHFYVAKLAALSAPPTPIADLITQWRALVTLGFAFMIAGLATTLGHLVVRSLVQNQLGADALGYFQAAWMISMTYIGFVLGAMGTDFYPRLTAVIHDHVKANRLVNEQTEVAILLASPVLLAMLALAPWVISLLYSNEFSPAANVLRWQILGDVIKVVSWPLGFILLAAGDGKLFMITEILAVLIFAFFTWLLLHTLGIEASGIAFFVMYVLYLPIVFVLAVKRTNFRWTTSVMRDFWIVFTLASTIMLAGMYFDWLGLVIGLISSLVLGFIALVRLSKMTELEGRLGGLANFITRMSVINNSKKDIE